jgi:protein-disulfide isomerase
MASRTKQKEAARAQRLAEEQARQERERRDRRLRMLGGVILAAVAVLAVAIAVSSGGGSNSTGLLTGPKAAQLANQVNGMFAGIPQNGTTLGNPKAPVTMTYYGDLECPVCQDFTLNGGFPQLVANDVRSGKVKIVYRSFQTATTSPQTFQTQQVAALAAGKQSRFWNYTDLFYHQQGTEGSGYVNENYLTGLARQVAGLSYATWNGARNNPALSSQVTADETTGHSIGVRGTPTLIFSGPKGQTETPSSVPSYSELQSTIKSVS